jgi:hypothetical protein
LQLTAAFKEHDNERDIRKELHRCVALTKRIGVDEPRRRPQEQPQYDEPNHIRDLGTLGDLLSKRSDEDDDRE